MVVRSNEAAKFPRSCQKPVSSGFILAHLALDTLHGATANATLGSNLQNALSDPQLALDSPFQSLVNPGPAELLARFYGPLKPGVDSLADHRALELSERARDLKHELSGRRGRVDRLLVKVHIDAAGL